MTDRFEIAFVRVFRSTECCWRELLTCSHPTVSVEALQGERGGSEFAPRRRFSVVVPSHRDDRGDLIAVAPDGLILNE